MNRTELITMVKNHKWSGEKDSSELKELISLYPWFQSVYTLLLDAQYSTDNLTFDESLKKNAVFVANREVLYYILRDTDLTKETYVKEEQEETTGSNEIEQGSRSREELLKQIESRLSEIENKEISHDKNDINHIETPSHEESNGILLLDEDEEIVSGFEEDVSSDSQSESLDLLDLDYPLDESGEDKTPSANELVDRFIETNPRIKPNREKMEEPIEDIAEKVEDNNPGLITETLAQIYINQKFYTRAILIYEKLSLKFPEKSSYFATQIEKIKELML